jgi:hypothetical protein
MFRSIVLRRKTDEDRVPDGYIHPCVSRAIFRPLKSFATRIPPLGHDDAGSVVPASSVMTTVLALTRGPMRTTSDFSSGVQSISQSSRRRTGGPPDAGKATLVWS